MRFTPVSRDRVVLCAVLLPTLTACPPSRAPITRSTATAFASIAPTPSSSASVQAQACAERLSLLPHAAARVVWSPGSVKLAAGDIVIDLASRQRTDTCCSQSDENIYASTSWGGDDVLACDRKGGGVAIHDFGAKRTVELDAGAPEWDRAGSLLLLLSASTSTGWGVYDRASNSLIAPPETARLQFDPRVRGWIGAGTLVRVREGDAPTASTRLWDAKTRSYVGPAEVGEVRLRSTSPSRAFVLELTVDADGAMARDAAPTEAYLLDALSGARRRLAGGISPLLPTRIDELEFFSPDSTKVGVPLAKGGVQLFDTATASPVGVLTAPSCETPLQIAWSPKGDVVATGSDTSHICVFDAKSLGLVRSWEVPRRSTTDGTPSRDVYMLAYFAGGRGLVAGNFNGQGYSVTAWSAAGVPLSLGLIGSGATGGARVTTRGDALVDHARLDTNLAVHEGDSWGQVTDITIDGRFMNGPEWAGGNELKSDGVPLPTFERGEGAAFVSISPDGAKVFGYVEQDPRVWDLNTGKLLFP